MSVKFQICSCTKCNAPTNLTYVSAKVVVVIGLISECTMLLGNNKKWHQMHFYKKYNQNTEQEALGRKKLWSKPDVACQVKDFQFLPHT